eukprot:GHVU01084379.1.p1 GENE.GHVU01084379.1~~GHVU01084379.1.p1  ORF type:complete len:168 (-),score=1.96 GHVU01084379.1:61-564(-)
MSAYHSAAASRCGLEANTMTAMMRATVAVRDYDGRKTTTGGVWVNNSIKVNSTPPSYRDRPQSCLSVCLSLSLTPSALHLVLYMPPHTSRVAPWLGGSSALSSTHRRTSVHNVTVTGAVRLVTTKTIAYTQGYTHTRYTSRRVPGCTVPFQKPHVETRKNAGPSRMN